MVKKLLIVGLIAVMFWIIVSCVDVCLTVSHGDYGVTSEGVISYNNTHEINAVVPFLVINDLRGDAVLVIGDGKIR